MTPHTPVEGLVAKWRETTPDDFNGCGDKTEACWERLACANELEQALASLPVEGWRVERVPDPPFEHDLIFVQGPSGMEACVIYGDNPTLWALLAHIAQRQGNEQGGTHE